jgi:hypothetical protein
MKVINVEQLGQILSSLPQNPRVVASGNFAAPSVLLQALDANVAEFKLHMLNAHPGIPDRDGVTYETAFVGPGMRHSTRLNYKAFLCLLFCTIFLLILNLICLL